MSGVSVKGYKSKEYVGGGSFGEVWQGVHIDSGKHVAIKVASRRKSLDESYLELDPLENERIVPFEAIEQNEELFIISPLQPSSLQAKAGRAYNDPLYGTHWFDQAAQLLAAVHEAGRVHGHLKPTNLLLDENHNIMLNDLGQLPNMEFYKTLPEAVWYVSPEQARGEEPSPAWDVFALGAVFYHVFTGMPPRRTQADDDKLSRVKRASDLWAEYGQLVEGNPLAPIVNLNPEVDKKLAHIVERCLELNPARRPDMASLSHALQVYLGKATAEKVEEDPELFWTRKRKMMVAGAMAFLMVLGGGITFAFHRARVSKAEALMAEGKKLQDSGGLACVAYYAAAAKLFPKERSYREAISEVQKDKLNLTFFKNVSSDPEATFALPGPDGSVVVGGPNTVLYGPNGEAKTFLKDVGKSRTAAWSPDGKKLFVSAKKKSGVWDAASGELLKEMPSQLILAAFSPDGKTLAAAQESKVFVWDTDEWNTVFKNHLKGKAAALNHQSYGLAKSGGITILDFQGGTLRVLSGQPESFKFLQMSLDGKRAVSSDGNKTAIWELGSPFVQGLPVGSTDGVFAPDNKAIVLVGRDGTCAVYSVNGRNHGIALSHPDTIKQIRLDPTQTWATLLTSNGVQVGRSLPFLAAPVASADLDMPADLLELEAAVYSGARIVTNEIIHLKPEALAKERARWESLAAAHALKTDYPSANLYRRFRVAPAAVAKVPAEEASPAPAEASPTPTPSSAQSPAATPTTATP